MHTFAKTHLIVPLTWGHFVVCKLYLNKVDFYKEKKPEVSPKEHQNNF